VDVVLLAAGPEGEGFEVEVLGFVVFFGEVEGSLFAADEDVKVAVGVEGDVVDFVSRGQRRELLDGPGTGAETDVCR